MIYDDTTVYKRDEKLCFFCSLKASRQSKTKKSSQNFQKHAILNQTTISHPNELHPPKARDRGGEGEVGTWNTNINLF
jgi:hypothetical protein